MTAAVYDCRSFFDKPSNSWLKVRKEVATFVGNQDGVLEGRISAALTHIVSAGGASACDNTPRVPAITRLECLL